MTSSDERLTALLREAWRPRLHPGGGDCPTDETLAALILGELEPAVRTATADHVARCRRCGESFRQLVRLQDAAASPAKPSRRRFHGAGGWALAAVLTATVGAAILWRSRAEPPPPDALRSLTEHALTPAEGSRSTTAPERFAWSQALARGSSRVRLYDAEGSPVWSSPEVDGSAVELPREIAERLAPGAYFWTVESEDTAGARLGPYWFELLDQP